MTLDPQTASSPAPPAGRRRIGLPHRWTGSRRADAIRIAAVPVLVLGVLLWMVVAVLRAGSSNGPLLYAEFVDPAGSAYLDVQLAEEATSYGAVSAVVPRQGRVWPVTRVAITPLPSGEVQLSYDGAGYRDRQVRADTRDEKVPPRKSTDRIQLRLSGRVDPARHTATVDLWVDGAPSRIRSTGIPAGAQYLVDEFLTAVRGRNWNAVYDMETASMRNGSKRGTFVTDMANAGVITTLRAARTTGPTTFSTSAAGVSLARTPIRMTYADGATTTSVDATLVLAVDGGSWGIQAVE